MSDRPVDLLIEDILESIEKIENYTSGHNAESFIADELAADAAVRNMEIIGEAANRLPDDFTRQHPEIEWRQIVGLRHRIIHEYFNVDLEIVWQFCGKYPRILFPLPKRVAIETGLTGVSIC